IGAIVVATTTEREDDVIEEWCCAHWVRCFRGSREDVLDRYYHAAKFYQAASILRITADCPALDPVVVDELLSEYEAHDYDACGLAGEFPDGLDCEVMSFSALERAWKEAEMASEREHVTPFIRESKQFSHLNYANEIDYSVFPSSDNVRDFNWDTDNEALAQAFVEAFNLDGVDQIKGLMGSIQTLSEDYKFISHKILWDGEKIIGRLLVYSKGDAPVGWLGSIVALGDRNEIEKTLMGAGLNAAKDAGINKVHLALWNKAMEKEANYSYLKVDFYDSVSYWEKTI
ncbi:MAG: hypothetical protein IH840_15245, partial [Candidatus Heimdallarchaeota archaeon]|nr:hypothetical protein [Candidatus Heimdallarchaeota archaeon]